MTNYFQLLCREINSTKAENKTDRPLEKVFFCSGTPSLVPPKLVNSVLETFEVEIRVEFPPSRTRHEIYGFSFGMNLVLKLEFFVCRYTPGEFPLPSETRSAEFYKMASRTLSDITANTI
ncbi:hypothetical protein ACFX15_038158 [Malus domestica]